MSINNKILKNLNNPRFSNKMIYLVLCPLMYLNYNTRCTIFRALRPNTRSSKIDFLGSGINHRLYWILKS